MRFIAFWMPSETLTIHYAGSGRRLERGVIYLMTLLSVPGLFLLYRRNVTSAAIVTLVLAIFPLIYCITQFEFRYRYPIMWVTFLLGALPITTWARRLTLRVEKIYDIGDHVASPRATGDDKTHERLDNYVHLTE
jgi:hypothetical protein